MTVAIIYCDACMVYTYHVTIEKNNYKCWDCLQALAKVIEQ